MNPVNFVREKDLPLLKVKAEIIFEEILRPFPRPPYAQPMLSIKYTVVYCKCQFYCFDPLNV